MRLQLSASCMLVLLSQERGPSYRGYHSIPGMLIRDSARGSRHSESHLHLPSRHLLPKFSGPQSQSGHLHKQNHQTPGNHFGSSNRGRPEDPQKQMLDYPTICRSSPIRKRCRPHPNPTPHGLDGFEGSQSPHTLIVQDFLLVVSVHSVICKDEEGCPSHAHCLKAPPIPGELP